ncbi:MAG: DNA polymerase III subunit delta [Clostridia bacterium]|nr:DNA polymerase III subunit delta [Clostridia bacterium]
MEYTELDERIKKASFAGRYIFGGEEDFLKRHYARQLVKAAIGDADDIFSHSVFDGEDATAAEVLEAVISPPLMSEYKVVEWRFPDFSAMREKELAAVEELAAEHDKNPDTVLIITVSQESFEFSAGKNKSKLERRFGKLFELVNFKKSTDKQLLGWLNRHFTAEGLTTDASALNTLLSRSGKSMDVLSGEVSKLVAFVKADGRSYVTVADVEAVSSQTPESETFAFQNAIVNKDKAAAFRALDDLKFRRVDPAVILAMTERSLTELLNVAMLVKDGEADKLGPLLGIRDFKARICLGGARRYGAEGLSKILSELVRLDAASKFGGISGYRLIELFISEYI